MAELARVSQRDGLVPMRGHKLGYVRRDVAYTIPVDFYSDIPMPEMLLWTNVADRLRVDIGGGYVVVGDTRLTAVDLGAFTAGQTKQGTIEVKVPLGADTRHEPLVLNLGEGY